MPSDQERKAEDFDNEVLLDLLDKERSGLDENRHFREPDAAKMKEMIDLLIVRGVYPPETAPGNPNTVYAMVSGWGARWFQWAAPLSCPHCKADLRNHVGGPPFKREIGIYSREADRTVGFTCPDCNGSLRDMNGRWIPTPPTDEA
jgi:hypothetical protein